MGKLVELYAWVLPMENGGEAIPCIPLADGGSLILFSPRYSDAVAFRTDAQYVADHFQRPIKLVKSTGLQTIEVLAPTKPDVGPDGETVN